jgi:hypothetical protein
MERDGLIGTAWPRLLAGNHRRGRDTEEKRIGSYTGSHIVGNILLRYVPRAALIQASCRPEACN